MENEKSIVYNPKQASHKKETQTYMDIIVAGCGKIGTVLIESLLSEGHDITAVDVSPEILEKTVTAFDVRGVSGSCAAYETLSEAEAEKADIFIAVTDSDELNMLSCFFARKLGAKHTVARIRKAEYNDREKNFMRDNLELSLAINPDAITARELFNMLDLPSSVKIETFSSNSFEMAELRIKPDSPLDGQRLCELREKYKCTFLVCAVQRGGDVFIPDGNFVLKSGDKIGITASPQETQKLLKSLRLTQKHTRSIMILGGSRTAYYLSKRLAGAGISVKIIEQSYSKCVELAKILPPSVPIVNGDGAEHDMLIAEGIQSTDAFVALAGMDEGNILFSFFAASQNVPKIIAKVNSEGLGQIAEKLGLDCVVSPKHMMSEVIVRYARMIANAEGSHVETLYKLMDGSAEAVEFTVTSDFPAAGIPLKELSLRKNILIGGIIRGKKSIIPTGDDFIQPGDRVVVIADELHLTDLSDILQ